MQNSPLFKNEISELLKNGFTKISVPEVSHFDRIQAELLDLASTVAGKKVTSLEKIHEDLPPEKINDFRVHVIAHLNTKTDVREQLIKGTLNFFKSVFGEDLAVQKNLNLVMLPPNDPTSILPLHADTWTGHSGFELVLLYPLFGCSADQNMFVLPVPSFQKHRELFKSHPELQKLTETLLPELRNVELSKGEAMVLWHATPHGNRVNSSDRTHWSLNLRFKNIFTPYEQKTLGDYFQPVSLSPFNDFVFKNEMGIS